MKIILASASPRRRELMKLITDDFETVSTDVDETLPKDTAPEFASSYLAELKAKAAAKLYPNDIVIGCDTVVILENKILGKPKDEEQCREYLRMLSGKRHTVMTSCCIIQGENIDNMCSRSTTVIFRKLSEEDINRYISTGEPFDKAGGYGIQGKGALLINSIQGDYFNVVGLPVSELNIHLKKFIKGEIL